MLKKKKCFRRNLKKLLQSDSEEDIDEENLCQDDELCLLFEEFGKDKLWYRCILCAMAGIRLKITCAIFV